VPYGLLIAIGSRRGGECILALEVLTLPVRNPMVIAAVGTGVLCVAGQAIAALLTVIAAFWHAVKEP
jgi:ABC-type transport system involved in cytochrome c biogenesis permease component